jgi:peptidoglycan/xylan/chitin deacetylase (PgdA/CDA1 family)
MLDDWEPHRAGHAIAVDAIRMARAHGDGAVIVLHTWPEGAADALRPMMDGLREAGASFVRVDELDALP